MVKIIKFGGTIINNNSYNNKILEIINNELVNNNKIIIVVSAIGRENDPYSTPTFESLSLSLNDKDKAELLSYGERISALVFLNFLISHKYNASLLSLKEIGIMLDNNYLQGNLHNLDSKILKEKLNSYDIIIVPGFVGITKQEEVCLLGKGGSDLTAIYLAKMLDIDNINLYKDVNGVMSGDPKIIADPITLTNLDYDECLVFAKCGARIVQDKAISEAKKSKIVINIYYINDLKLKSVVSNTPSNFKIKGVMSKDNNIYLIGDIKNIDCEDICKILDFYHFECVNNDKNKDYLGVKIVGGKRNFAMNVLHHHFISKKIK